MPERSATRDAWQSSPLGPTAALAYHASFSQDEYAVLCRGLIPSEMEDKWFIFWEADSLFFHRSWTGYAVYRVDFRPSGNQFAVASAFVTTDDEHYRRGVDSYEVALLDFLIRGLLLRQSVEFPLPPGFAKSAAGLYQHHVAGTGFPERALASNQGSLLSRVKRWIGL